MVTLLSRSFLLVLCIISHLRAATANDIVGEWVIDGPATWEAVKKLPQPASASPERLKNQEQMILSVLANKPFVISADKMITDNGGPDKRILTYKVLGLDGDTVKVESDDSKGWVENIDIVVKEKSLALTFLKQKGFVMVLTRKPSEK